MRSNKRCKNCWYFNKSTQHYPEIKNLPNAGICRNVLYADGFYRDNIYFMRVGSKYPGVMTADDFVCEYWEAY